MSTPPSGVVEGDSISTVDLPIMLMKKQTKLLKFSFENEFNFTVAEGIRSTAF